MSEGLKPHYHQYYLYDIKRYYDRYKKCMIKHATFRCMICGKEYHERYEYKPPPRKEKNKDKEISTQKKSKENSKKVDSNTKTERRRYR